MRLTGGALVCVPGRCWPCQHRTPCSASTADRQARHKRTVRALQQFRHTCTEWATECKVVRYRLLCMLRAPVRYCFVASFLDTARPSGAVLVSNKVLIWIWCCLKRTLGELHCRMPNCRCAHAWLCHHQRHDAGAFCLSLHRHNQLEVHEGWISQAALKLPIATRVIGLPTAMLLLCISQHLLSSWLPAAVSSLFRSFHPGLFMSVALAHMLVCAGRF